MKQMRISPEECGSCCITHYSTKGYIQSHQEVFDYNQGQRFSNKGFININQKNQLLRTFFVRLKKHRVFLSLHNIFKKVVGEQLKTTVQAKKEKLYHYCLETWLQM